MEWKANDYIGGGGGVQSEKLMITLVVVVEYGVKS